MFGDNSEHLKGEEEEEEYTQSCFWEIDGVLDKISPFSPAETLSSYQGF